MKKDIFNYILKPTIKEFREVTPIDKLYDIEDTYDENTGISYSKRVIKDILVSDTIKNYKNDVLMTKIQYANALKYYSILQKEKLTQDEIEAYKYCLDFIIEYMAFIMISLISIQILIFTLFFPCDMKQRQLI